MDDIKVVLITPDLEEDVLETLREGFFPDENICKAARLLEDSPIIDTGSKFKCTEASVEFEILAKNSLKDRVSVEALDSKTNEMLGVAVNKLLVNAGDEELSYFEQFRRDNIKTDSGISIMKLLTSADNQVDLFKHFEADCGMEIVNLAVKPKARGRKISQILNENSIRVAREYKGEHKPKFVAAVYTSRFSQKSGVNAGIPIIVQVPYTNYSYKGLTYAERIGPEHPSYTVSGVHL